MVTRVTKPATTRWRQIFVFSPARLKSKTKSAFYFVSLSDLTTAGCRRRAVSIPPLLHSLTQVKEALLFIVPFINLKITKVQTVEEANIFKSYKSHNAS